MNTTLINPEATAEFGRKLGRALDQRGVVFLNGTLGAGKTTLCRGLLRGLGYQGAVKSPTFTLVEPYELAEASVYHFDLYRLAHPDELEYLGVEDYFTAESLCLIEWPERGVGCLMAPDLELTMTVQTEECRQVAVHARSTKGEQAVKRLAEWL